MTEKAEKLVYSAPEVAQVLGISRSVAYRLMRQPDFPSIHLSECRIVVPIESLKAWLSRRAEKEEAWQ